MVWLEMGRDPMLDMSWLPSQVDPITEYYYCNKLSPMCLGNEGGSAELMWCISSSQPKCGKDG